MRRALSNDGAVSTEHVEDAVWKGGPSQVLNLGNYALSVLLAAVFIVLAVLISPLFAIGVLLPLGYAGWKFLVVRCRKYELTTQRLRFREGVLNQDLDEIELYRVKDLRIELPFWLRIFGLANIHLETSDRTHPRPVLAAVQDGEHVREELRKHVESCRDRKRVREVDFDETGDSEFGDEFGDEIG